MEQTRIYLYILYLLFFWIKKYCKKVELVVYVVKRNTVISHSVPFCTGAEDWFYIIFNQWKTSKKVDLILNVFKKTKPSHISPIFFCATSKNWLIFCNERKTKKTVDHVVYLFKRKTVISHLVPLCTRAKNWFYIFLINEEPAKRLIF